MSGRTATLLLDCKDRPESIARISNVSTQSAASSTVDHLPFDHLQEPATTMTIQLPCRPSMPHRPSTMLMAASPGPEHPPHPAQTGWGGTMTMKVSGPQLQRAGACHTTLRALPCPCYLWLPLLHHNPSRGGSSQCCIVMPTPSCSCS